ncbi:MAG: SprT family zinc-dependent metalloprotease [Pseudomonadota bacterium]
MKDITLDGDPPILLKLRRSARARRLSLRVSQLDGRVTLTLPARLPEGEALSFAHSKQEWIRDHLAARAADVVVAWDAQVPVAGDLRRVVPGRGRSVVLGAQQIGVPGKDAQVGPRLAAYLRGLARDQLVIACDAYAARLGRPYARITLRDTRSRWGSCTSTGNLMFSWRLIMAPPEVLAYVAAHEVAHLAQMNHSPAFWAEVERIYGPYAAPRKWLRVQGAQLHRYRFDAVRGDG